MKPAAYRRAHHNICQGSPYPSHPNQEQGYRIQYFHISSSPHICYMPRPALKARLTWLMVHEGNNRHNNKPDKIRSSPEQWFVDQLNCTRVRFKISIVTSLITSRQNFLKILIWKMMHTVTRCPDPRTSAAAKLAREPGLSFVYLETKRSARPE